MIRLFLIAAARLHPAGMRFSPVPRNYSGQIDVRPARAISHERGTGRRILLRH